MKKILFFSQVCYLDIAIEYIQLLTKSNYEVHVLIELPHSQLRSNILNLNINLDQYDPIVSFHDIEEEWGLGYLSSYFEHCKSVNFSIYKSNEIRENIKVSKELSRFVGKLNPDFLHLDDLSPRAIFLMPFFLKNRRKLVINIHDPKQHMGEFEWKRYLVRKIFNKISPRFIVFSKFSKDQLKNIMSPSKRIHVIRLMPYTVYNKFVSSKDSLAAENGIISFIGRISPYKGVEIFLEVIEELAVESPELRFMIAGKLIDGYSLTDKISASNQNLLFLEKHLTNSELVDIISKSQLIVCPYLEATQSGVIMTAKALNRPVLVSNVGALPEYVQDNTTGIVIDDLSKQGLKEGILNFVKKNQFENFISLNVRKRKIDEENVFNLKAIKDIYHD
jgi:glycosyltransferase involved in cell wall biosynthesis